MTQDFHETNNVSTRLGSKSLKGSHEQVRSIRPWYRLLVAVCLNSDRLTLSPTSTALP